MKLRGLNTVLLILIAAGALLTVSRYLKTKNNLPSDDMKSHLTAVKGLIEKKNDMVERVDFNDNILIKERLYTEAEINEMTESQFALLLKDTELRLPKISDIKNIPEGALHRVPAPVLSAGKDLSLLNEILKVHTGYEKLATNFYETCAKNSDRPLPVRAICLTNLIGLKKKNGEKINTKIYPSEMLELTKMVTDL